MTRLYRLDIVGSVRCVQRDRYMGVYEHLTSNQNLTKRMKKIQMNSSQMEVLTHITKKKKKNRYKEKKAKRKKKFNLKENQNSRKNRMVKEKGNFRIQIQDNEQ
eukprot:TRINITY_DN14468_c0_g1_i1.p3 TRINITY_DN14468_c0_g1~~TRINITY_DN14468_c0_g1_i1.p3  ORF type:complete len:104 (+),score=22.99 TRINITY_DN14468_c0_g1_i1:84-395(+)